MYRNWSHCNSLLHWTLTYGHSRVAAIPLIILCVSRAGKRVATMKRPFRAGRRPGMNNPRHFQAQEIGQIRENNEKRKSFTTVEEKHKPFQSCSLNEDAQQRQPQNGSPQTSSGQSISVNSTKLHNFRARGSTAWRSMKSQTLWKVSAVGKLKVLGYITFSLPELYKL